MFSTMAIVKNSKFSGKVVGTHQRLDQSARRSLTRVLPKGAYFPTSKEILYFEGSRGPDGLKRKSPGIDEPSHMLVKDSQENLSQNSATSQENPPQSPATPQEKSSQNQATDNLADTPAAAGGHESLDTRSVIEMIMDHRWNLVRALKRKDQVRAAFEAAWMAHMITDGLTPAHHFPLSKVKDELMTDKELMKVFGQPIKGVMHGRTMLETMRNNWLYWGAGGHMSKHIAYEYGVIMIVAALPLRTFDLKLTPEDLSELDTEKMFRKSLERVQALNAYQRFLDEGWTTDLATETKNILLPEIVRAVTLGWYSAVMEAYRPQKRTKSTTSLTSSKKKGSQHGQK